MPPQPKPPRLWLRKRKGREPAWIIRHRGKQIPTGANEGDREQAERALEDFLAHNYKAPAGRNYPHQIDVTRILEIYGQEHAPHTAAPDRIGYAIDALTRFWDGKTASDIRGNTCRQYVEKREVSVGTARRELECLQAALRYCEREGYLINAPRVTLPPKPKGRVRWLTRKEAARLLLASWRDDYSKRHLPTFILIGLYTGTRHKAILDLQWHPNTTGGWVDMERGLLFRSAQEARETNKRQTPCPIPPRLLSHLRRVRARTDSHVIEWWGKPTKKLRRSWHTAREEAGLEPDVTPHALRHTCVTWLLQKGVSMWEVAGYVGMSELMVRRTYGHHAPDFLSGARDAF